jgi:uncharacterized repeat protein (TIGR01451 family)
VTSGVLSGQVISYTILVVNYGVTTATNVVVSETLPEGTTLWEAGPAPGTR